MSVHWNISVLAVPYDCIIKSLCKFRADCFRDADWLPVWKVVEANIQVVTFLLKTSMGPTYKYHNMGSNQTSKMATMYLYLVHLTLVAVLSRTKNVIKFNFMGRTRFQIKITGILLLLSPLSLVFILNSFSLFSLQILMLASAIPMLKILLICDVRLSHSKAGWWGPVCSLYCQFNS